MILRLRRSVILFAINIRKANITRLKAVYHCVAIELAIRRIELKKALAIASAFFLVEAAVIETASENQFPRISTSVVYLLRFPSKSADKQAFLYGIL